MKYFTSRNLMLILMAIPAFIVGLLLAGSPNHTPSRTSQPPTATFSVSIRPTATHQPSPVRPSETATMVTRSTTTPEPSPTTKPTEGPHSETVYVSFQNINPTYTQFEYSGEVTLVIEGTGQAGGLSYSDAFYLYTDWDGVLLAAPETEMFDLEIDGQRAIYTLGLTHNPPAYNSDHVYIVQYNVGPEPRHIAFRISDQDVNDNTGSFTITVRSLNS